MKYYLTVLHHQITHDPAEDTSVCVWKTQVSKRWVVIMNVFPSGFAIDLNTSRAAI